MSTFLTEINDLGTRQTFADAMRRHQHKWNNRGSSAAIPAFDQSAYDPGAFEATLEFSSGAETIANTRLNSTTVAVAPVDRPEMTNDDHDEETIHQKRSSHGQKSVRWKDFEDLETASNVESVYSSTTPSSSSPQLPNSAESVSSQSSTSLKLYLGVPSVVWSAGPAAFGRIRFDQVNFLVSAKQAGKMRASEPGGDSTVGTISGGVSTKGDLSAAEVSMKLSYKMSTGIDAGIVRATLANCGFKECGPTQGDWNLFWCNGKMEPHDFRTLNKYQKINKFPRMSEMCRKDKLYLNISRMKQVHGDRHFDFIPHTFLLPQEYDMFYTQYLRTGGRWIVKPVNATMMKGSHVIDSLAELPTRLKMDDRFLVQKFIENPLKVNGCRFDLRVYVAVTSFNPLRIYMFQEGIIKYIKASEYKHDPVGQKTTLTSILRHISNQNGSSSSSLVLSKIKDIIVKTFLTGESVISTAASMFVSHPGNCFELLGFDMIIDANLNPWLIEVATSPSLTCEGPLDMEIKGALVADLLTLIGIIPFQKHNKKSIVPQ
ncbi:tubulin-tyrosine ligase family-domain-containing protein [Obelidium mucronatum]|nr:tubulin-tyrosine ligase family-domain-containing protein [Obelidium mucronatum]